MPTCDELIDGTRTDIPVGPTVRDEPPAMPLPRSVCIVGGGIKGLTVAMELLRGFDAARLRRTGREPVIVILEQDSEDYRGSQRTRGGLFAAAAVGVRDVLRHVPRTPDEVGSTRLRPQPDGQAALDAFVPVVLALPRAQFPRARRPKVLGNNVLGNVKVCVDALVAVGAPPAQVAAALDRFVTYMHKDPAAREHTRDDTPEVALLTDCATAFGRLQWALSLAAGGGGALRPNGFGPLHAASFCGRLWPVTHPVQLGTEPVALWRCDSTTRNVIMPMTAMLARLGVVVRYGVEVTQLHPQPTHVTVSLARGAPEEFDMVVDARGGGGTPAGGLLVVPGDLERDLQPQGVTVVYPESAWLLVTTLVAGGVLDVTVGFHASPGLRFGAFDACSADEALVEIMLQLGFSLQDARDVRWVHPPHTTGPRPPVHVAVPPPTRVRDLLAFEIGTPPTIEPAAPGPLRAPPPIGRLVQCRAQVASRSGGARTLGPACEAGKLTVQQIMQSLALRDCMRAATLEPGASVVETLVCVGGLDCGDTRLWPVVTGMQRWTLFNHLAQHYHVGYAMYVTQAVAGVALIGVLIVIMVLIPVVSVWRFRTRHTVGAHVPATFGLQAAPAEL